ncbi:MAG: hypothetical protein AB7I01_16090 [Gammaproteobacteria bacterium]
MTGTPTPEQDPLVRLAARRPQAVCASLEMEPATREALAGDPAPAALLSTLIQGELLIDALTYLAHALPPADAVAWACACVPLERELGADAQAAIKAAEAWCMAPNETHSRAAETAADSCSDAAAQLVAQAAFWGGGNIAPVGLEPVPPPPGVIGTGVAGALMLAAAEAPAAEIPERYRRFLSHGILIARTPM